MSKSKRALGSVSILQDAVHYALRANPATASDSAFDGEKIRNHSSRSRSWLALAKQALRKYGISAAKLRGLDSQGVVQLAEKEANSRGWDARSDSRLCSNCRNPTYGNPQRPCPHH